MLHTLNMIFLLWLITSGTIFRLTWPEGTHITIDHLVFLGFCFQTRNDCLHFKHYRDSYSTYGTEAEAERNRRLHVFRSPFEMLVSLVSWFCGQWLNIYFICARLVILIDWWTLNMHSYIRHHVSVMVLLHLFFIFCIQAYTLFFLARLVSELSIHMTTRTFLKRTTGISSIPDMVINWCSWKMCLGHQFMITRYRHFYSVLCAIYAQQSLKCLSDKSI